MVLGCAAIVSLVTSAPDSRHELVPSAQSTDSRFLPRRPERTATVAGTSSLPPFQTVGRVTNQLLLFGIGQSHRRVCKLDQNADRPVANCSADRHLLSSRSRGDDADSFIEAEDLSVTASQQARRFDRTLPTLRAVEPLLAKQHSASPLAENRSKIVRPHSPQRTRSRRHTASTVPGMEC